MCKQLNKKQSHRVKMSKYHNFKQSLEYLPKIESSELIQQRQNQSDFDQMQRNLKLVKYPTVAIKPVIKIDDWIQRLSSQSLRTKIQKTLKTDNGLNFLREVRGDGNCFIRAVAFQYLSKLGTFNFKKCFPYLDQVKITCSDAEYIPKNFLQFYDNQLLNYCLKNNWQIEYQKQLSKYDKNCKLALASLFAQNPYLDFIIVLYTRAVSVLALEKYKKDDQIKDFLQISDKQSLRNYGNLSDGLTHFLVSRFMDISLNVYQLRQSQIQCYNYKPSSRRFIEIHLLLHDKHYDLLHNQANINAELINSVLNRKESYYSNQNDQMVEGQCMNCCKLSPIYIQSNLCEVCLTQYKSALTQFKKNKIFKAPIQESQYSPETLKISMLSKKLKTEHNQISQSKNMEKKKRRQKKRGLFGCFGRGFEHKD